MVSGARFGSYEVVERIGAGGMGEVWRARDTALKRDVAVKVLPESFAGDAERLSRFRREAEILASLNHPNIAQIYDLEALDDRIVIVMELVEGPTLADRIADGHIPQDEALAIARQIADGLEAAHSRQIVHRDLKPANIKLRDDGTIKLLDFGISKAIDARAISGGSPVMTTPAVTEAGVILGTAAYMSPEQARGKFVDQRTDIWAFGCLLFEMLTGQPAFGGEDVMLTLARVLDRDTDLSSIPKTISPAVRHTIRLCLEKDPRNRIADIRDVRLALQGSFESELPRAAGAGTSPSIRRRATPAAAGFVAAGIVALAIGWAVWPAPVPPGPVSRFEAWVSDDVIPADELSVSPDGRKLVFTMGGGGLWIRDVGALEWQRVPGGEGGTTPFWSPDSRYLGFAVGRQLRRLDMTGGPPETFATLPGGSGGSASWNINGDILLGSFGGGSGGPLWKVSQTGGVATALTQVDVSRGELYHTWPTFLPDGSSFLYFRSGPPDVAGMYVGSLDAAPAEQSLQRIFPSTIPSIYANGHVFFLRGRTLMAQPFNARSLQLERDAVPVAEDVEITWFSTAVFGVSSSGALAYRASSAIGTFQLTWFDRQGKTLSTIGAPSTYASVALSPDGTRAVVKDSPYGVPGDLWMLDLESGARARLTLDRTAYSPGVWSPDGALIAYAGGDSGDTLYAQAASGLGGARELLKEPGLRHYATSWSRDGRFLLYHTENAPNSGYDLWALSIDSGQAYLLLGEAFNEWAGTLSPDMRWVAYTSTEAGGEIYVRPFLVSEANGQPAVGEGKWQISDDGGNWALWRYDREIVFNNFPTERAAFAVPVDTSEGDFRSGVPQRLEPLWVNSIRADSAPDGQRFLIAVPQVQGTAQPSIRVVLNWPALLSR
jgi:Tol biopolymer transport system component